MLLILFIEGPRRVSREEAELERQNLIRQTEESRRNSHITSKRAPIYPKGSLSSQFPRKRQSTGTPDMLIRKTATRDTIMPEKIVPYPKQLTISPTPIQPSVSYETVYV